MITADQRCRRCSGCGRVIGTGREEHAWSEFRDVPTHLAVEKMLGMRNPRTCPDCGGSGAAAEVSKQ